MVFFVFSFFFLSFLPKNTYRQCVPPHREVYYLKHSICKWPLGCQRRVNMNSWPLEHNQQSKSLYIHFFRESKYQGHILSCFRDIDLTGFWRVTKSDQNYLDLAQNCMSNYSILAQEVLLVFQWQVRRVVKGLRDKTESDILEFTQTLFLS